MEAKAKVDPAKDPIYRIWVNYEGSGNWQDWTGKDSLTRRQALERMAEIDHPARILMEGTDPNY